MATLWPRAHDGVRPAAAGGVLRDELQRAGRVGTLCCAVPGARRPGRDASTAQLERGRQPALPAPRAAPEPEANDPITRTSERGQKLSSDVPMRDMRGPTAVGQRLEWRSWCSAAGPPPSASICWFPAPTERGAHPSTPGDALPSRGDGARPFGTESVSRAGQATLHRTRDTERGRDRAVYTRGEPSTPKRGTTRPDGVGYVRIFKWPVGSGMSPNSSTSASRSTPESSRTALYASSKSSCIASRSRSISSRPSSELRRKLCCK